MYFFAKKILESLWTFWNISSGRAYSKGSVSFVPFRPLLWAYWKCYKDYDWVSGNSKEGTPL